MKIQRTDDPDISFLEADPVTLWCYGIIKFKVDTRNRKFIITPIMRDGCKAPIIEATEMHEKFLREQRRYDQARYRPARAALPGRNE